MVPTRKNRVDIRKFVDAPMQILQLSSADGLPKDPAGRSFFCRDISIKGLNMETEMPLQTGDILEMALILPGENKKLILMGEVRRIEPTERKGKKCVGAGIRFLNLTQEQSRYLINYMAGTFLLY